MLQVSRLCASYGAIRAVRDVSLEVPEGNLVAVLGANGAGKSTLVRSIAGVHREKTGDIVLDGKPVQKLPLHRITRRAVPVAAEDLGMLKEAVLIDPALEGRPVDEEIVDAVTLAGRRCSGRGAHAEGGVELAHEAMHDRGLAHAAGAGDHEQEAWVGWIRGHRDKSTDP